MKASKNPPEKTKDFRKDLCKHLSPEDMASFILTVFGMSDLAHRFIYEKVSEFMEIPIEVKYSPVNHAAYYRTLGAIARGEVKKGRLKINHLPVNDKAWQSEEDFEQRFIFIVTKYYEQLKKEGKIK